MSPGPRPESENNKNQELSPVEVNIEADPQQVEGEYDFGQYSTNSLDGFGKRGTDTPAAEDPKGDESVPEGEYDFGQYGTDVAGWLANQPDRGNPPPPES